MADKLGLGPEIRELKLGASFTNPKTTGFHTLRYDFKPASVDVNQMATMDVGTNSQVTVTIPPNTVFKGSSKPYQKQCIVIINRDTKEITLEKLSCNIQVKKTRSEGKKITSVAPSIPTLDQFTSKNKKTCVKAGGTSKNSNIKNDNNKSRSKPQLLTASLGSVVPKHSPLHASPNQKSPNPGVGFSPSRQSSSHNSLPVIGSMLDDNEMDDKYHYCRDRPTPVQHKPTIVNRNYTDKKDKYSNSTTSSSSNNNSNSYSSSGGGGSSGNNIVNKAKDVKRDDIGILSDSSSSSSSSSTSGSSSDSSDSESVTPTPAKKPVSMPERSNNSRTTSALSVPEHLLTEDLQLSSESGSESD